LFVPGGAGQFYQGGQPYTCLGANLWYGMHLGRAGELGDRERLLRELDHLKALGVTNLRVLASSEGPNTEAYRITPALQTAPGVYDETVFVGLDFLLEAIAQREMKAVMVLSNFWMWSGGFPQYRAWAHGGEIPYPDIEGRGTWDPFIQYSLGFFTDRKANRTFRQYLKTILSRRNTINGRLYKEDPTIMAWQLCNEPRGYDQPEVYQAWVHRTARFIKQRDRNHLVSIGAEGNTGNDRAGIDLLGDSQSKHIDYATTHLWIQNWGWFAPDDASTYAAAEAKALAYLEDQVAKAQELGKPLVLEEFGVGREGGQHDPNTAVAHRDRFYEFLFTEAGKHWGTQGPLQGLNFWSWGGEGRPSAVGGMWQAGHTLIGDPPHERQGIYSVYNHDESTLKIIESHAQKLASPKPLVAEKE